MHTSANGVKRSTQTDPAADCHRGGYKAVHHNRTEVVVQLLFDVVMNPGHYRAESTDAESIGYSAS